MGIEHITEMAVERVFGRLIRRVLMTIAVGVFGIVAVSYFTVAGTIALEGQYGELYARLIVGAIYAAIAIAIAITLAINARAAKSSTPALSHPREMQIAMLIEAVMLGYSLARKGTRAS
jgi:hypothetical protein